MTFVMEILPRNSPSILNFIVNDIQAFACTNNMRLNPKKCKTMAVDFLHYNSCISRPIDIGGNTIEKVSSFKLLGVYLSDDLSWGVHCDYVMKRANRRMFALRQLRKCGVPPLDIVAIYCSLMRSVLEYGSVVFADLPSYLSNAMEAIQKRALAIIWPGLPYVDALERAGISTLFDRRVEACEVFIKRIPPSNPLHPLIHKRVVNATGRYSLRSNRSKYPMPTRTDRFKNFVTVKYQPVYT